jgi:hypothetical protein
MWTGLVWLRIGTGGDRFTGLRRRMSSAGIASGVSSDRKCIDGDDSLIFCCVTLHP